MQLSQNAIDDARHANDVLYLQPAHSAVHGPLPATMLRVVAGGRQGPARAATGVSIGNGHLQREVFAFAPYWSLPSATSWDYSNMTTLAYFGLDLNQWGGFLNTGGGWTGYNSQAFVDMVNLAHAHGDRVVLVIKLFNSAKLNFLLTDASYRQTAITSTINLIERKGLDGVNVDFEGSTDGYPFLQGGLFTFMTDLHAQVHARWPNAFVSIDSYTGSASWDYGLMRIDLLAPVVDAFFIMAYDMAFSNLPGKAGPNAPISGWTYNYNLTVSQYLTKAPASKIIVGVPYYGYKYCTTSNVPYSPLTRNSYGTPLCPNGTDPIVPETYAAAQADVACKARNLSVRWDTTAQSPMASWYSPATGDPCGGNYGSWRELYWDNVQSLGIKYDLVNRNNLRGAGIWALGYDRNARELWNLLSVKFAYIPSAPGSVNAYSEDGAAAVSWSPPTVSVGGRILNYTVVADPGGGTVTVPGTARSALVYGLANGTSYTFTVTASNAYGSGITSAASNAVVPATPAMSAYFAWYDRAAPGLTTDAFAVANPGASPANVLIVLPGALPLSLNVPAGSARAATFPAGSRGGPVLVSADGPVVVSQRVLYYQSFSERAAVPASGLGTSLLWPWYDWKASGIQSDYFYVANPGPSAANVSINLAGASPLSLLVAPGSAGFRTFPKGTAGGPVSLTSDQPVLATQRVVYQQSFIDIPASLASAAAANLVFPWYDWKSPGFKSDYFYVANPGATPANVTIILTGAASLQLKIAAHSTSYRTFPQGTAGGPVRISSDQSVIASERFVYNQSATEVPAAPASSAAAAWRFPWYDWKSSGFNSDYIYVANPGAAAAAVTVTLGAKTLHFTVLAGTTGHVTFPFGTTGGPVSVTADHPILVSQRVVYGQSGQEFAAVPA